MNGQTMKGLAIVEIGKRADLIEAPVPEIGEESVLVRTLFSGVSIGTEMWMATGQREGYGPVPFINGYQGVGEIVRLGGKVEGWAVGEQVVFFGGQSHAQYVKVHRSLLHRLPDPAQAKGAALFVQPCVGANALNQAGVNCGDVVLVIGQGLVGQATAQLARLRGAYVIATDVAPVRLALSRQHCADWTLDAARADVPTALRERFPEGADVVIESTGFTGLLDQAFACAKTGGRFVFEGWYPGDVHYNFHVPHMKQLRAFYPCFIGGPGSREGVLRLIASGALRMAPLISHCVPWREAPRVYNLLFTDERNALNGIVFDWSA